MSARRRYGIHTLVALAGLLAPGAATAQYEAGQTYVGAHVGMSGVGSAASFGVNGEVAYNDQISIGAWADTWSFGQTLVASEWDVRYWALAGTGAYHFPIENNPRLDPFVGAAVGYFVVTSEVRTAAGTASFTGDSSRIFAGAFGGVRYHFRPNLAGVARAGFGASYLTIGVDLQM